MVTEGSTLTLSCNNYTSVGPTDVSWQIFDTIRGNYEALASTDIQIFGERDFVLYFPAVQMRQQGKYRCRVENTNAGEFRSGIYDVRVTGRLSTLRVVRHSGQVGEVEFYLSLSPFALLSWVSSLACPSPAVPPTRHDGCGGPTSHLPVHSSWQVCAVGDSPIGAGGSSGWAGVR